MGARFWISVVVMTVLCLANGFVVHGLLQASGKPNFYSGQLEESETTVAR